MPPASVRLLINDEAHGAMLPDQVANMSRPDIVRPGGLVPNAEHGFLYKVPDGFFGPGKHTVELRALDATGAPHFLAGSGAAREPQCVCNGGECAC